MSRPSLPASVTLLLSPNLLPSVRWTLFQSLILSVGFKFFLFFFRYISFLSRYTLFLPWLLFPGWLPPPRPPSRSQRRHLHHQVSSWGRFLFLLLLVAMVISTLWSGLSISWSPSISPHPGSRRRRTRISSRASLLHSRSMPVLLGSISGWANSSLSSPTVAHQSGVHASPRHSRQRHCAVRYYVSEQVQCDYISFAEPCTSSSLALSRVLTMTLLMLLSPSLHVALAPLSGSLVTGLSRVTLSFAPSPLSLPFLPRLWFLL
jgi:hypothetical protein